MISIQSAISRSIIKGRNIPKIGPAFLQANLPFLPSSSSDQTKVNNSKTPSASVRYASSPAYRRYMNKKKTFKPASIGAHTPGTITIPTLEVALDMGKSFTEMENEPLIVIAEMGNHSARREVLRRHIMAVDMVDYEQAGETMEEIARLSRKGIYKYRIPYWIGISVGLVAGIGIIPMVYNTNLAMAFNEAYVTMEVPRPSDLDTVLETGFWSWNWLGPFTGTFSFTLLCIQFVRQQFENLGVKPITEQILKFRSRKLIQAYPNYSERLLRSYVESDPMVKL